MQAFRIATLLTVLGCCAAASWAFGSDSRSGDRFRINFFDCAHELNRAASVHLPEKPLLPWIGANYPFRFDDLSDAAFTVDTPAFGWVGLTPEHLYRGLVVAGVSPDDASEIIGNLISFSLNAGQRDRANRDTNTKRGQAAILTSFAAGTFQTLDRTPMAERKFFFSFLPPGLALSSNRQAEFVYQPENFKLIDVGTTPERTGLKLSSQGPVRRVHGILLTIPDVDNRESMSEWYQQVLGALGEYSYWRMFYTWIFSNRLLAQYEPSPGAPPGPGTDEWFDAFVGIDGNDFIFLDKAFFRLSLTSVRLAIEAYVNHRVLEVPFDAELQYNMAAAIAFTKGSADPESIDRLDMTAANLFEDLVLKLQPTMYGSIDAAKKLGLRGRRF